MITYMHGDDRLHEAALRWHLRGLGFSQADIDAEVERVQNAPTASATVVQSPRERSHRHPEA